MFYWIRVATKDENIDGYALVYSMNLLTDQINPKEIYSAFTVAELGEMIPHTLKGEEYLCIFKGPDFYNAYYNHEHGMYYGFIIKQKTLADCLADFLAYLLENKLMELLNE